MTDHPTQPIAPELPAWGLWESDRDRGARAAHTAAAQPPEERPTWEAVQAEGPAFWTGYSAHWDELLNAGMVA